MDQGVGGCLALFNDDDDDSVPEMDALGYKVQSQSPNMEQMVAKLRTLNWNGLSLASPCRG